MTLKDISVFGLGKLGSPLAITLAARGFRVVGVDRDPKKVDAIQSGEPPVFEPGLVDMLAHAKGRLTATLDGSDAVLRTDVTFIIVPTPSEDDGSFSLEFALEACETIGKAISTKDEFHLVVVTSTVMPGSTGGPIRAALEATSRKVAGRDFGLCYNPEFIALGSVVRDLLNPDFVLIGESDPESGAALSEIYETLCENDPPIARLNYVNAELAKLAVNTFVTTKISFANMIAQMCERLPDADVDEVTSAVGLDSRIGKKYLKGGIAFGGPCFPRDNHALISLAAKIGAPAHIAEATFQFNDLATRLLADLVVSRKTDGGQVAILGLAYKPNTDVVERSQGLLLAQALIDQGIEVSVYDPSAMESARGLLPGADLAANISECVDGADVVVITTPWDDFRGLDSELSRGTTKPGSVIDCWGILDPEQVRTFAEYIAPGVGPSGVPVGEIA
jgi:UDPglucose 6-dehydrogenase